MKEKVLNPSTQADSVVVVGSEPLLDALFERELQQQERLHRQIAVFSRHEEALRRRRQTAIVATLANIASVAALLILALVWQFYFPVAEAVAAILP